MKFDFYRDLNRLPAWGVVVAVISSIALFADEPVVRPREDPAAQVSRLVAGLDADSKQTREQSERALLELGPIILPELPAPDRLPNDTVRDAVRRVRVVLEQQKARASVEPSRITFHGTVPLRELLRTIAAQSGNEIEIGSLPEKIAGKAVAANFDREPFWSVMNALAIREQLAMADAVVGKLRLQSRVPGSREPAPKAISTNDREEIAVRSVGAFRVVIRAAEIRPSFVKTVPQLLRFQLGLISEPRLRPLFLNYAVADFVCETENKSHLEPTSPKANVELPVGEGAGKWNVQIDFNLPLDVRPQKTKLRGKLTVLTAAAPEKFVFDRFPDVRSVSRRQGGVTVTVDDATLQKSTQNSRQATVRLAVNYDTGGPAFESHRSWIFQNEAWLEGPDGRRLEFSGVPLIRRQDDGGMTIEYNFTNLPLKLEKFRFIYVAPTLLIDVPVEFEFGDVILSIFHRKDTAP